MWKHVCGTLKRVHFSAFRIFHLEVLQGPRKKKISHWNQSKWRRKQSRTFRQGSVRSRPGSQKPQATMTTLQERGPEGARRRPPRTPGQGPSPPPRLGPRWGGDGRVWGGDAGTDSLHAAPRPPGGDPGAAAAEPTLTHTPLRPRPLPQRPAPSLTVSPGNGLGALGEQGELTLGLRPAEGRRART